MSSEKNEIRCTNCKKTFSIRPPRYINPQPLPECTTIIIVPALGRAIFDSCPHCKTIHVPTPAHLRTNWIGAFSLTSQGEAILKDQGQDPDQGRIVVPRMSFEGFDGFKKKG